MRRADIDERWRSTGLLLLLCFVAFVSSSLVRSLVSRAAPLPSIVSAGSKSTSGIGRVARPPTGKAVARIDRRGGQVAVQLIRTPDGGRNGGVERSVPLHVDPSSSRVAPRTRGGSQSGRDWSHGWPSAAYRSLPARAPPI